MTGLGIRRTTTSKPAEALALPLEVSAEPAFRHFSATKHVRDVHKPARDNRAAASELGISKSFLHDMHSAVRPVTAAFLRKLGLQKSVPEIFTPID